MPEQRSDDSKIYLIGGGIASLAAAAFLIRDGNTRGHNILILEDMSKLGGSLDATGNAQDGYVMRGGRMLESKYLCTFDLFSSIPTLDGKQSVTEETFAWNKTLQTSSKARLFRGAQRLTAPKFGLSEAHILTIERLEVEPEGLLGCTTIADQFTLAFFETDFWFMWCTTFACQPWHSAVEFKRYLVRFTHMVSGFNTLAGIMRTVHNQYDSLVQPLQKWLEEHGVQFHSNRRVTDLRFLDEIGRYAVDRFLWEHAGVASEIAVGAEDGVIVTLGSMTEASSLGSMDVAPKLSENAGGPSWALWQNLASFNQHFGQPENFSDHVEESQWVSFTSTLCDPEFFRLVEELTGNAPGEGGLVTFPDSSWLLSIVLPHQPHFIGQPEDVTVFWGYGLYVGRPGNFVHKPMSDCTGREIMTEVLGHLRIKAENSHVLEKCICIPCMMPFITSQFLRRGPGDRPEVFPEGSKNLAFIGQFCELPDDVVSTIEYSIRSAQQAVYGLLGLDRTPPPVYKGKYDPRVIFEAFLTLHDYTA